MNFDSHSTEVLFSGRAEDHLNLLVWNKFDEKHCYSWLRSESMDGVFTAEFSVEHSSGKFNKVLYDRK